MARYNNTDETIKAIRNRFKVYFEIPCDSDDHRVQEIIGIVIRTIEEQPTADVVPWYQLYHSIKEELKQEKMYHRETENLCDRYCIESQQAKNQVAREIFEELKQKRTEYWNKGTYSMFECWCKAEEELEKKYTGEK